MGARSGVEMVARAPISFAKIFLIDGAIVAYLGFVTFAIVAGSSQGDAPSPAEAWAIIGFTALVLLGLLVGFGHFLLQYEGLLGALYAREATPGWEFGPRWGFVLRHRLHVDAGETLTIVVDELPPARRGGKNYGKYRWTLSGSSGDLRFRSPVGLSAIGP